MAKPKLEQNQKLALLEWMAEGLKTAEVNERAAKFDPPFEVSPQLMYQYRTDYEEDLTNLRTRNEMAALHTGLSLKAKRIEKLVQLAEALEDDIFTKRLVWIQQVKGIGSGLQFEKITFEEFNAAEIKEYRGVLDDIAKETGGRIIRADITSKDQPIKGYVGVSPDDWDNKDEAEDGPKET